MSDVDRLLSEYKAAHREAPATDPFPYVERARGIDRELLAGLIDAYLENAPRRAFDPAALRGSPAAAVAEETQRTLQGSGGLWPSLLPRLRRQARLQRSDLVAQLAARLGAQGQRDKVGLYYHRMEQGLLPEEGVSDTVLEALGRIVGQTADVLRRAGRMPRPGPPAAAAGTVFARTTPEPGEPGEPGAAERPGALADEPWDEVDRLFRGRAPSA